MVSWAPVVETEKSKEAYWNCFEYLNQSIAPWNMLQTILVI